MGCRRVPVGGFSRSTDHLRLCVFVPLSDRNVSRTLFYLICDSDLRSGLAVVRRAPHMVQDEAPRLKATAVK